MSEADWWLCSRCNSLNDLAARKCYRCDMRKPKDAALASEVRLVARGSPRGGEAAVVPGPRSEPAPIREPIRRHVLAVAPRPPHPATITYRLIPSAPRTRPPGTTGQPPMPPPPAGSPPRVAIGPGPPPPWIGNAQPWPHWRELLDAPVPDAHRLRPTRKADAAVGASEVRATHSDHALSQAIRRARMSDPGPPRGQSPWPTEDHAPDDAGSPDESETVSR